MPPHPRSPHHATYLDSAIARPDDSSPPHKTCYSRRRNTRATVGVVSVAVEFDVRFYRTPSGGTPIAAWLDDLKTSQPVLERLIVTGLEKLHNSARHGPPLTTQVDPANGIYELRVGSTNIARVFFFFQPGRAIIVTNGYVKKRQRLDPRELRRAQDYQRDWKVRHP